MTMPGREGQTFAGTSTVARWASFVKLPHTVFALPFALTGVVFASRVAMPTVGQVGWVVLAFTCARFAAMAFNRIIDRDVDAINPRTRMREIPSGALQLGQAKVSVAIAGALFMLASWMLNPLCGLLSPVALAWVLFYSYCKRFTRWSHLVLGLGLGIAPVGGYLAVTGAWSTPVWMLPVLALAVMTWSGGFDILYALQDVAFDRANKLFSLPAALGAPRALNVARVLHVGTVLLLALVGWATGGGPLYALGVACVALLLGYEHSLVKPDDLSKLDAAFFTMNGIISITFFTFVLLERVLQLPSLATLLSGVA
ncbi:MAG TPA: UbiA-like polyprenyltransferase [Gemmatimonadaceae bacterium]|nr:UbiA-like polyprenyltransferase [Gemmatimonadaceae bacterium]